MIPLVCTLIWHKRMYSFYTTAHHGILHNYSKILRQCFLWSFFFCFCATDLYYILPNSLLQKLPLLAGIFCCMRKPIMIWMRFWQYFIQFAWWFTCTRSYFHGRNWKQRQWEWHCCCLYWKYVSEEKIFLPKSGKWQESWESNKLKNIAKQLEW
jgi:hypothetical protein